MMVSLEVRPPLRKYVHGGGAGNSFYSSESNSTTPAGFKQYCVPVPLAPGWHRLELRYSKSPLDRTSVFRFFVVDAEQVRASGDGTIHIWKLKTA